MGHLNGFFAPRGGNLNKPVFKSSNARGVARGGMLNFRIDRRINDYSTSVVWRQELFELDNFFVDLRILFYWTFKVFTSVFLAD